jgi:GNAT superfamily N-acetyltransferase
MNVYLRNLSGDDLLSMLSLERLAWPEGVRASMEELRDRLQTFGEGFFGAYIGASLIGMASCQIIRYSDDNHLSSWTTLTADGWISKTHCPDGNCLHFVSVCVHPDIRHLGIATRLNQTRIALAEKLGLQWALTDTRIPGLNNYLEACSVATPEQYLEGIRSGTVLEPIVKMYLTLGFQVRGLIPNCMVSDVESGNYGLAMVKKIRA